MKKPAHKTPLPLTIITALLLLLTATSTPAMQTVQTGDPRHNPDNYISVDFDNAPLKEVIFTIADYAGAPFVFNDLGDLLISWTQRDIYKHDVITAFTAAVTAIGLTCQLIDGPNPFYLIKQDSQLTQGGAEHATGIYHLQNISAEAVKDAAEILYGQKLSVGFFEGNQTVAFSGSTGLVQDFSKLLQQIDRPLDDDLEVIRLKHISVRTGLKALADLQVLESNSFFPDHWNSSILVRGTAHQRSVARLALNAIDQPQEGWVDQVAFVHTTGVDQATEILTGLYNQLEIRTIGSNRLLISGPADQVDKATATLTRIDGTGLQVKVEAIIAYLTDREFKELGLRLSYENSSFFGAINNNILDTLITRNTGLLIDYFNDVLGLSFAAKDGNAHGEILSSPMLTVLNGQAARIHVGQNVPYLSRANFNQNDGQDTGTSIERQDVGITFRVQPYIEPDGDFIHLTVDQVVSNVTGDSALGQQAVDIIFDKKEISSTVLVADGDTIFLGGLRTEETGKATDHIPFLSALPIIGQMFTYDADQHEQRHLIVSLRVNVIEKNS
ncbi:MAG: hypothetical protein KQH59_08610 [Desulfobulbaceae bacterium]|nr:hypothetical protein [Desulfobulbaceae bacterium]